MPSADTNFNFGAISLSQDLKTEVTVPLVTLDSLNMPACRMIKIDTEGMELEVLKGAKALIERCRPLLYVENRSPGGLEPIKSVS